MDGTPVKRIYLPNGVLFLLQLLSKGSPQYVYERRGQRNGLERGRSGITRITRIGTYEPSPCDYISWSMKCVRVG